MKKLFTLLALSALVAGCATAPAPQTVGTTTTYPPGTKAVDDLVIAQELASQQHDVLESKPNVKSESALVSAVVVTECTLISAAVFTYADGSVLLVDKNHHEAFAKPNDVLAYAEKAPWHVRSPAACAGEVGV